MVDGEAVEHGAPKASTVYPKTMRALIPLLLLAVPLHAAIVRGKVTTALGKSAPGARVQLILLTGGARNVAAVIAGVDGSFEISTDQAGRFLLLTTPSLLAQHLQPQLGEPFYAGRTDLIQQDVALDALTVIPQVSALQTLRSQTLALLAEPVAQVRADLLQTQADLLPALRATPSTIVIQAGPTGEPARLLLRGAPSAATKILLDGVAVEDLGGGFDLSTLGTIGLASGDPTAALELSAGPSPLHLTDAEAGLLAVTTAHSSTIRKALVYTGDAGPLGTLRQELAASIAPRRADLFASVGRFNTSNEQPSIGYHLITAAAGLDYRISGGTALHLTARRDLSSAPQPLPLLLYGFLPPGKLAAQNTYGSFSFDTRTEGNWHNRLSYGLVRKRAQSVAAFPAMGSPVTITGANGYAATGTAVFPQKPTREDAVTDRDEFTFQSDRPVKSWLVPLLRLRYQDERAADLTPALKLTEERHHLDGAAGFTGALLRRRLFYEAAGELDHSPLLGFTGAPRAGLTYAAVQPGRRRFHGTVLHAAAATGSREPSVLERAATANLTSPRSRSLDFAVDQTILPGKLTARAGYFHQQFSHEFEYVAYRVPSQTLGFRTQGLETQVDYRPATHLQLRGSYTYMAALVEHSAAVASINPALAALPIGVLTALPGARPFDRPPHSGFVAAEYSGRSLTASVRASAVSRSDGSTGLAQTPALLLPNRNLSPGYVAMDAAVSYRFTGHITAFTELNNLFDNRRIAPIGYTSAPFLVRAGLRLRLGGE